MKKSVDVQIQVLPPLIDRVKLIAPFRAGKAKPMMILDANGLQVASAANFGHYYVVDEILELLNEKYKPGEGF